MPRVTYLNTKNPTEDKIVALLYGALEREGIQKQELAEALGMKSHTLPVSMMESTMRAW